MHGLLFKIFTSNMQVLFNYYLSVFLRPVITHKSLHYKGDLFLVKGALLLVESTKILSKMLSSTESWQNCDVLTNSTWLFKDLVFNLTTDHEHFCPQPLGWEEVMIFSVTVLKMPAWICLLACSLEYKLCLHMVELLNMKLNDQQAEM